MDDIITTAMNHISAQDKRLAAVIAYHGKVTLNKSSNYFHALCNCILGQQLSKYAAKAIRERFASKTHIVSPAEILKISLAELREMGISNSKAKYIHGLSLAFCSGYISDNILNSGDYDLIERRLLEQKGIGNWTIDIFKIFSLNDLDVLPLGDAGIQKGIKLVYNLSENPDAKFIKRKTAKLKPYRSIAALYYWKAVDEGLPEK